MCSTNIGSDGAMGYAVLTWAVPESVMGDTHIGYAMPAELVQAMQRAELSQAM